MSPKIFISYGGPDQNFADGLRRSLNAFGINTFFFKRDAQPGRKLHRLMRDEIDENDLVILICSKSSLSRAGVINEIEEALQREARLGGEPVLIPLTLDGYVYSDWAPKYPGHAQAIRDRVIADFRGTIADIDLYNSKITDLRDKIVTGEFVRPTAENVGGRYRVNILDAKGHKAQLIYGRSFRPIAYDMRVYQLPDLTADGKVKVVGTNIGKLRRIHDEGGRSRLEFYTDSPLEFGKQYDLEVTLDATDCYYEETGTASLFIRQYYPFLEIEVTFPEERRPIQAALWRTHQLDKAKLPDRVMFDEGRRLFCHVDEPRIDASYILEWQW